MGVRVLQVVGDSKFGGASRIIIHLAEVLGSVGWSVDLLATDPAFIEAAHRAGLSVVPLDVIRRKIRPLQDLLGLIRLRRYLRKHRYSIVHTHTTKAGFIGRVAARLAGVPLVVHTLHGFAFHEKSRAPKIWFYSLLEMTASACCDRVLAVSRYHMDWAKRLGVADTRKLCAIENGVPDQKQLAVASRAEARHEWGLDDQEFVLLTPGRLAAEKGLEHLIEAATILRRTWRRPFRILLAGDGDLRTQLEALVRRLDVAGAVTFLGFQTQIPSLLTACDVVVLPTLREGLSISLLEAMSAGVPIIATDIGSNREATRDGEAALLIPTRSPAAIADAVSQVAANPALAQARASRARQIYLEHYGDRRMLREYYLLYLELLREKRITAPEGSSPDASIQPIPSSVPGDQC